MGASHGQDRLPAWCISGFGMLEEYLQRVLNDAATKGAQVGPFSRLQTLQQRDTIGRAAQAAGLVAKAKAIRKSKEVNGGALRGLVSRTCDAMSRGAWAEVRKAANAIEAKAKALAQQMNVPTKAMYAKRFTAQLPQT